MSVRAGEESKDIGEIGQGRDYLEELCPLNKFIGALGVVLCAITCSVVFES